MKVIKFELYAPDYYLFNITMIPKIRRVNTDFNIKKKKLLRSLNKIFACFAVIKINEL